MKKFTFLELAIIFTVVSMTIAAAASLSYKESMCGNSGRGACGAVNKKLSLLGSPVMCN